MIVVVVCSTQFVVVTVVNPAWSHRTQRNLLPCCRHEIRQIVGKTDAKSEDKPTTLRGLTRFKSRWIRSNE